MKKLLVILLGLLSCAPLQASDLRLSANLGAKGCNATAGGLSFSGNYDQQLGLGLELATPMTDTLSLVFGGDYFFRSNANFFGSVTSTAVHNVHAGLETILIDGQAKLFIGGGANYCFVEGIDNTTGAAGYQAYVLANFAEGLFAKLSYEMYNATTSSGATLSSSGAVLRAGLDF